MEQKSRADDQQIMTDPASRQAATLIQKRIESFSPLHRSLLTEIKCNIAYMVGQQNIQLVGDQVMPLDDERAIQTVENVILPAVQNDMAVGTSRPPLFDVVPAGTDDDDKATAIAGEKMIPFLQRKFGRGLCRDDAIVWYDISGVGWRKVYWNPDAIVEGVNPAAITDDGRWNIDHLPDLPAGAPIMSGDLVIESVPTSQLIWDFRLYDLFKLPWIIHCLPVSADWVRDRYGLDVYEKLKGKFSSGPFLNNFEVGIMNAFNEFRAISSGSTEQRKVTYAMSSHDDIKLQSEKHIMYCECWQIPTKSHPAGMYAEMVSDQLVKHQPYPVDSYPHQELPFIPAYPVRIKGATAAGISRISQARPIQRDYNRLLSQIDENLDIMGNAVFMAPRNAKVSYRKLDNRAGNIIEYDSLGKPTREPGVPMNSQVFVLLAQKRLAIDNIFSFHAPSRGSIPKSVESGKGILALQRTDVEHQGPVVAGFEQADERLVFQALTVAFANYDNGKLVNVVGSDYEWTLFKLDKNQLRGKFNVIVKQRSSFPPDKTQEAETAFMAWNSGLLGDPMDPQLRVWTMQQMSLGNADNLFQRHSKQRNFAMKEFIAMEQVAKSMSPLPQEISDEQLVAEIEKRLFTPPINPFDDHYVHQQVHGEYMIDNYWKLRATGNPIFLEMLNRMQMHIAEHQAVIQSMQEMAFARQLEAQMLVKGKTPQQIILNKTNFDTKGRKKI